VFLGHSVMYFVPRYSVGSDYRAHRPSACKIRIKKNVELKAVSGHKFSRLCSKFTIAFPPVAFSVVCVTW